MCAITIEELRIADDPQAWAALGFAVQGEVCAIGGVRLRLVGAGGVQRGGILGWSLRGLAGAEPQLDGLTTTAARGGEPGEPAPAHPNGVVAIDHVVAMSPDLDRSVAALRSGGLDLRRVREQPTPAGAPRQAFFRLGAEILELVQEPPEALGRAGGAARPARFWGLALASEDLDATLARMAPHAGAARAAVQPGRRIATVRRSAGLTVALALMSVEQRAQVRA